jgi:hypothetical protein
LAEEDDEEEQEDAKGIAQGKSVMESLWTSDLELQFASNRYVTLRIHGIDELIDSLDIAYQSSHPILIAHSFDWSILPSERYLPPRTKTNELPYSTIYPLPTSFGSPTASSTKTTKKP